jgi:hypothetical protein
MNVLERARGLEHDGQLLAGCQPVVVRGGGHLGIKKHGGATRGPAGIGPMADSHTLHVGDPCLGAVPLGPAAALPPGPGSAHRHQES